MQDRFRIYCKDCRTTFWISKALATRLKSGKQRLYCPTNGSQIRFEAQQSSGGKERG